MTTITPVYFGKTTWTSPHENTDRVLDGGGSLLSFADIDQRDFDRFLPFGVKPQLNKECGRLQPRDGIGLALSFTQVDVGAFPETLDDLGTTGRFMFSVHYPERGMPQDANPVYANSYADGYEIQHVDSRQKALGLFDYLAKASLPGGERALDGAREALFLDILMRANLDIVIGADATEDFLKRWASTIGRHGEKVTVPGGVSKDYVVAPALAWLASFAPESSGGKKLLSMATQYHKHTLQRALFAELVQDALPETSKPHQPLFDHLTNPIPAEM